MSGCHATNHSGIASSILLTLAAKASPNRIHSYSVGFEELSYDESPYARQVAEPYGTELLAGMWSDKRD